MPMSAEQVLPVVRVGEIANDELAERWLVEQALVRPLGRCDRRRPQECQDVAWAGHGPLRSHGDAMPGQVRRA